MPVGQPRTLDLPDGKKATLKIRRSVAIKDYPNCLAIGVEGEGCQNIEMRQFVWVEVSVTDKKLGNRPRKSGTFTTTSGTVTATTDTSKPNWHLDTYGAYKNKDGTVEYPQNEYYSRTFTSYRTKNSTTIYDQPGFPEEVVKGELTAPGADIVKVTSTTHGYTEIVLDDKIIGDVGWKITYVWEVANGAYKEKTPGVWDVLGPNALAQFPENKITAEQSQAAIKEWKRTPPAK